MKKHLVLLFGLLLALIFAMPSVVVAADIEFGPPDMVVGQVNIDDVLMGLANPAEKGSLLNKLHQLQSCPGCTEIGIGPAILIGFNTASPVASGHLGGVLLAFGSPVAPATTYLDMRLVLPDRDFNPLV